MRYFVNIVHQAVVNKFHVLFRNNRTREHENKTKHKNIPSTVYVFRQMLPVLCLPRSNWSAPAVYEFLPLWYFKLKAEIKKQRTRETKTLAEN